jgi:hypothetical protein
LGNKQNFRKIGTKLVGLCRSWGIGWGIGLLFPNYPDYPPAV